MGLSDDQRTEVETIAELQVRRQMNELFESALPRIVQAAFSAHNSDVEAHKAQIETATNRWKTLAYGVLIGVAVLGGSEGVGWLAKVLGL